MFDWLWELVDGAVIFMRDALFDMIFALFRIVIRGVLELVGLFGLPEPPEQFDNMIGSLPAEMVNIFVILGGPEAVGIITTALIIRFGLGLIPFVRAGR